MQRIIVWLRNDLRVHDNPVLDWAAKYNVKGFRKEVIPVYSFDPRFYATRLENYGSLKCGLVRARFITETIDNLRANLGTLGSGLLVTMDKPEVFLPKLISPG